jgi:hypothetical protein
MSLLKPPKVIETLNGIAAPHTADFRRAVRPSSDPRRQPGRIDSFRLGLNGTIGSGLGRIPIFLLLLHSEKTLGVEFHLLPEGRLFHLELILEPELPVHELHGHHLIHGLLLHSHLLIHGLLLGNLLPHGQLLLEQGRVLELILIDVSGL